MYLGTKPDRQKTRYRYSGGRVVEKTTWSLDGDDKIRGRKGEYRGYDDNGKLVPIRDIDFTDHGRPKEHSNPHHQHDYLPNPTGGTPQHGPAVELVMPK